MMGFVRQSKYIFPWILRFIFGKKQKYFWICQKYIEKSVNNPPNVHLMPSCAARNSNVLTLSIIVSCLLGNLTALPLTSDGFLLVCPEQITIIFKHRKWLQHSSKWHSFHGHNSFNVIYSKYYKRNTYLNIVF